MADVFLGSVYATLELRNVDQFQRQLGNASQSGTTFKNTMLGVFAGNLLTQGFQMVTQAVVGFAKEAVTGAADLQSSMGLLQAVTGATQAQMDALGKQSVLLGNDITLPAISATDAADAMIELGKAGLSVNDIMGASKGVLQAATAGQISVADSAKIVSGALLTFGLKGTDATDVADKLAAAANASSLELGDVGFALSQAGAQASIAGLSLSDTVGIIAQMANKGISARQAGTSLSYMLKSLLAPTEQAKGVMDDLGLKMFDASGKFIGARAAIEQLQEKTKGLTQEQKASALSTVFGAEALKAANVVINDGVSGYDKMQEAINKQGAAQELAKARMVGFNGAMESLKNTISTTALQIGQVFLPVLTSIAKFFTGNFVPILAGVGAGLAALAGYFLVTGLAATTFGAIMAVVFSPITLIVAAAVALGAGLAILQAKFDIFGKAASFLGDVFNRIKEAIQPLLPAFKIVADFVGGQFKSIFESLGKIFDQVAKAVQPLINTMVEFYQKHAAAFQTAFKVIGIAVAALTFGPLAIAIGLVIGAITILAKVLGFIADNFNTIKNIILTVIVVALSPLIIAFLLVKTTIEVIVAVVQFLGGVFASIFMAIFSVVSTVFNAIMLVWTTVLQPVFDAIVFVITALFTVVFTIFSAIAEIIFTVVSTIVQIIGVILYGIVLFIFNNILRPIGDFFATIWNGILAVVTTVVNAVLGVVTGVFNAVKGVVMSVFNAVAGFISGVWNTIYGYVSGAVNSVLSVVRNVLGTIGGVVRDVFNGAVSIVTGFVSNFLNAGKDVINGIVKGISNGKDAVVNKIKDICSGALDAVKSFFGIKSPSKVMEKMFGFVMKGGENGITKNAGSLLSAFNDATNLLPSAMSIPITATGSYAGAISGQAAGGGGLGGSSSSSNGNVSIGEVTINSRQDDSRFLQLIGRNTELAQTGMIGAGA